MVAPCKTMLGKVLLYWARPRPVVLGVLLWCGFGGGRPTLAQSGSPAGAVPTIRLQARRAALLDRLGDGVAVLPSSTVKSIEGDYPQDSDYRESNDFFYLTGLEVPGAFLVLSARKSGPDQTFLYIPARDTLSEKWTGPQLGTGEAARLSGIGEVRPMTRAAGEIGELAMGSSSPARRGALYLPERQAGSSELLQDLRLRWAAEKRPRPIRNLDPELAALRLVKDEDELSRLRRAIAITAEGLKASMQSVRPGMWEYQLEATIEYSFRSQGAERVGFPSIVASGPNSVVLHYDKNRRQLEAGDLVVEDVGAEFGYYSADLTRTIPVSGHFSPRQRALYELVRQTQQAAIDSVRPGITLAALNRIAREYMRDHSGDLCGPGSCVPFFIHGLSHWLGMDVHDVGMFSARLESGMVLTVEPGIYLPEEKLGIRIEDDVLVTAGGAEVLSRAAPSTPAEIELAMGQHVP
jgi:Xaa-Pro aminopeptidase